MTAEELRKSLEEPLPDAEDFELAPGVVLKIRGVVSFDAISRATKEAEALRMLGKPVQVAGESVSLTDENVQIAIMVTCGVVEPRINVRDTLMLSGRYGMRYGEMVARIAELSSLRTDALVETAKREISVNPSEPGA